MKEKRAFVMMDGKRGRSGFTLVELLTVLAIISMLVGLLVPSLAAVRRAAKEALQRSRLNAIEAGLLTFRNDNGDYPRSDWTPPPFARANYCGAQKLAEALLGQDLLGFHPQATFIAPDPIYNPAVNPGTLDQRKGRYLDLEAANAFRLEDLFANTLSLHAAMHVICDVFTMTRVRIGGETFTAGAPILYYRANTGSKTMNRSLGYDECIYNVSDNDPVVMIKSLADGGYHPLGDAIRDYEFFYEKPYIIDPKATAASGGVPWPYRPDSFLLISAGADGLYGSDDDICNFGN